MSFARAPLDARHVADAEGDGVGVEAAVGKRQRLGIALDERDRVVEPALDGALAPDREHLGIDVDDGRARARAARRRPPGRRCRRCRRPHRAARTGRARSRRRRLSGRVDQRVLPGAVQPARHQVVHQVVAARDAVEHVVDQRLLVVERHVPEAEMGVLRSACAHRTYVLSGEDHSATPERRAMRRSCSAEPAKSVDHARTARSRDRAPRPCAGHGGRALPRWRRAGRDLRWPLPKDFAERLEGKTVAGSAGAPSICWPICPPATCC